MQLSLQSIDLSKFEVFLILKDAEEVASHIPLGGDKVEGWLEQGQQELTEKISGVSSS